MRNMRVDTTELCLNTFSEYEKAYIDKLAQHRGNISVVAISPLATQFEPQLFSPNVRVRTDAETIFKKVCYCCAMFGARYYTFRGPINLDGSKKIDYMWLAQRLNQLADIAATYGVALSFKNVNWAYSAVPEFFEKIMDLCPKLYATLDLFNAEKVDYELREFLDACPSSRISLIEVADVIKGEWCLPGRGKYNFEKLFLDLEKRKISAPVLISVNSSKYTDYLQVRDSFEWLVGTYRALKTQ